MIQEMSKLIENEMAGYTLNSNLFHSHTPPESLDRCTTLLYRSGGEFQFDIPDRTILYFQILNRAIDDPTAEEDAFMFYEAYKRRINVTLPVLVSGDEFFIEIIEAQHPPQQIGQDEKRRFQWSTNYRAKIKRR